MTRRNRVFLPENKEKPFILSMIIDIAEQGHCQLPWKGTQSSFKDPFKQMIVGVKEHGYGWGSSFPNDKYIFILY